MPLASEKNAILADWEQTCVRLADAPAMWAADGTLERTFADIEREAEEWRGRFCHLPAGSVLALPLANHPEWPALILAAFRQELVPLPLPADTREETYRFCGPAARVARERDGWRVESLANEPVNWPGRAPEFLKLTSGTTSRPRAVLFTAEQLRADCRNICRTMGLGPADRNFGVIPFSHSYGFSNLVTPLLCEGIPLVCSGDPFPRAILDGLAATEATVLPGVPALFAALAQMTDAELPPGVRLCLSAGALLPVETAEAFFQKFGRRLHSFYGSSECGGICYDRQGIALDGFVGETMEGVEFRMADVPEVRSAAVAMGYFPPNDALRDGAFYPADLLERHECGWRITGRSADLINVAGRKANPEEIEACLRQLPGITDCVVFGIARGATSVIGAWVVSPLEPEAIRRHCAERLPAWQVPKHFRSVERIPRNERGKINRRELAQLPSAGPSSDG